MNEQEKEGKDNSQEDDDAEDEDEFEDDEVAAVFLGGQRSPIDHASADVTSREWTCALEPECVTRADGHIEDVVPLPFVALLALHRTSVTSSHVDAQTLIKNLAPPFFTSGPGSSKPDGMLSNPFCFIIQVAAVFLGGQRSPIDHASADVTSREWTCALEPECVTRADGHIEDVVPLPFVALLALHRTSVTSSHVDAQTLIKNLAPPFFTSGPGSSKPDGMLSNPFCFIIQVAAVFLGGQRSPIDHASADVTSREWTCALEPECVTRADGHIEDVVPLPFVALLAFHRTSGIPPRPQLRAGLGKRAREFLLRLRTDCSRTAKGAHRMRSVRRRKLSSTSCCSAPATTTSAVSSSVFTAAWDFHT
ncbi:hypothetical protein MTO96_030063 [Rhipicephalus appendiculatus]